MFITKSSLSRRTVLKTMGTTLALPLLDAMVPALTPTARTAAAPAASARCSCRWASVRAIGRRRPTASASSSADPQADRKVSRPCERGLEPRSATQGTHAVSAGTWLTGSAPKRTEAEDFRNGTSLDQIVANKIGQETVFPSIQIATEDLTGYVGACDTATAAPT